jgi:hypothetical protein
MLSRYSDSFPETAEQQQQIIENMTNVTKDIIDLSHETFYISPQMSKSMGSAHRNMRKSISELENRRQRSAGNAQIQSMAGLNEAIIQMQNSMQMAAESNSALGFEQYLQQMQQMAKQQGQLNAESLNLFQGNQGKMSLQEQGQMQRMAAQQRALQKSLEKLSEGMQNRSDVLGDLNHMTNEMGEVVEELQQLKLDRKTIERQQKILSRMLDAQKSVQQKEYSKKRLAEVGKDYMRRSPSDPKDAEDKKLKQLSRDLLRALQEGYSRDYEKLIEAYFRALNTDVINQ